MDETKVLAEFLSELTFDRLPPEVVQQAKLCIVDTVGVAVASIDRPWSQMTAQFVEEEGGRAESSVWGRPVRVSARQAALVNGTGAHGIEMDDRVPKAHIHPGCHVVPSALAAAEKLACSGRELLTGIVAGYDLGIRVGYSVHFEAGLHRGGHKGIWPSVGAAAKVLGLSYQQTLDALGMAGSMASGLMEFSNDPRGTMVARLHAGLAASNGILAATLAQSGFSGPSTVLEGEYGYCKVFSRGGPDPRLDELTRDLGEPYRIMERVLKPYSAWGGGHLAIDAVGLLLAKHDVKPEDVESIDVGGSPMLVVGHEMQEPRSMMAGQFSLPFVTAITLCRGPEAFMDPVGLWTDELLGDEQVLELSRRTNVHVDGDLEALSLDVNSYGGARVTLRLRDGQELQQVVLHSRGTHENPMTTDEVVEKFRVISRRALPSDAIDEFIGLVGHLEDLEDCRVLGDILATSKLG